MKVSFKIFVLLLLLASIVAVIMKVPHALVFSYCAMMGGVFIWLLFFTSSSREDKKSKTAKRILIIDDDQVNSMITKKYFLSHMPEYQIEHCSSATEGLVYIKRNRVDVILLDLLMPDIQGDYVIRKLKNDSPDVLQKVIVYTSLSEHADEMKDVIANRVKYISKPTNDESIQNLVDAVQQLLKTNQTG